MKEAPLIRIGTVLANLGHAAPRRIAELQALGFESFEIAFKNSLAGTDLKRLASEVKEALDPARAVISCLGIYGNTLAESSHGEEVREALQQMIHLAPAFGTDLVCCFTGRVPGTSIPDSLPRFRDVFSDMARRAEDCGVRLAFENCLQGGSWQHGDRNLAHNPAAWQLLFDAVASPALGLEWEPAHQLCQLMDPLPQIQAWGPRIFHLHGKDAQVRHDILRRSGVFGGERFAFHRFPGLGDSNWAHIFSELTAAGFRGAVDIEGGHDPVYRGDLEMAGQTFALRHLKHCRVG